MRTTLNLQQADRNTLRAIAQQRGERGVARVVEEAVALYLTERARPAELAPVETPVGRWQRLGAELDRHLDRIDEVPGVVAVVGVVRALVRGGLRRITN